MAQPETWTPRLGCPRVWQRFHVTCNAGQQAMHALRRPRFSGDCDLYRAVGGGSEAEKKVFVLQLTSNFGPL